MSSKTEKISCPTCHKEGTWKSDNAFRPFCSHRCKLIDLGEWADGSYQIPGDPANLPTQDDENEDN